MGKSIITLLLVIMVVFSCHDRKNPLIETPTPVGHKHIVIDGIEWDLVPGSDGHTYATNNGGAGYVLFHYIDCELCKRREDTLKLLKF